MTAGAAAGQVPATVRVFIAGNSGSGKTTLAERLYLSRAPRVLYLDLTGEWLGRVESYAYSVDELRREVRRLAAASGRWRAALSLDPDEFPDLVDWLVPVPNVKASPVLAVGGAVILVDEVDLLAPPGTAGQFVRTLYRRSRHVGLSVISTTQRPANVSREVSAQSTHAIALTLNEARDVDYIARLMRWTQDDVRRWQDWTRQHRHGGQFRDLQSGQVWWVPESGNLTRPTQDQRSLFDDGAGE